jgi:glycosyltransferase involved in cell wall biosynthesis
MTKVLSIIIPMYNVERFLVECVNNININDIDYEIIMVNDGSPDNSVRIAEGLASRNLKIKVISQENKGLGGARNTGIKAAQGKYILFLDADDILVKQSYSFLNVSQLDIIEFSSKNLDLNGNTLSIFKAKNIDLDSGIEYCLNNNSMFSACNKVYSRKFLMENNLFFKEHLYIEDFEFNTRAYFFSKKVGSRSEYLEFFLQSKNSITRNNDIIKKKKLVNDILNVMLHINSFKEKFNLSSMDNIYFNTRLTYLSVDLVYHSIKNKLPSSFLKEKLNIAQREKVFHLDKKLSHIQKNFFRKVIKKKFILSICISLYSLFY